MKRSIVYVAILLALCALPTERADVGKLRPIQTVSVSRKGELVILRTDTKDMGAGSTALQALENLKQTTAGIVYLDTAEYLLVTEDALDCVDELREVLHARVKLCRTDEAVEPSEVTGYLAAHDDLPRLKDWNGADPLPRLKLLGERLLLEYAQ